MRALLVLSLALGISFAAGQAATSSSAAQRPLATRLVLATVTDAGSQPVVGLGPDDFVIEEGGGAREVFDVRAADYPVVVLLDNGADSVDTEAIRRAAGRFVSRLGDRAVAVGALTDPTAITNGFEDEPTAISKRIEGLPARPGAALNPVSAIVEALRIIRGSDTPFAAIVAMVARPFDPAAAEGSGLLRDVLGSRSIVHVVGKHPRTAGAAGRNAGQLLYELAEQTGGRYTTVYAPASYGAAMDRVADRLATEMLVEYLVSSEPDQGRDVRVGVRVPGARVRGLGVWRPLSDGASRPVEELRR
jgi:hypothetical protein